MNPDVLYVATIACGTVSLMILGYLMAAGRQEGEVVESATKRELEVESPIMRLLLQLAKAIAPLRAGAESTPRGQDIDRMLRKAGRPFGMNVAEYLALSYVGAAVGGIFGWGASIALWNEPYWPLVLVLAVLGFIYPKQKMKTAVRERELRIFRDLPYVLDMLTLSTEAGQDFSSAMATVIEKGTPGPLLAEFRIVHQEVTLGKTRAEALRGMAGRIDLPEVTSFVMSLIQAEQLGTSIGKVLRIMAEQMRVKRSTIAEEMAGKVPVKLMMPLMLLIVPASFIVLLFGPIYLYATGQQLE